MVVFLFRFSPPKKENLAIIIAPLSAFIYLTAAVRCGIITHMDTDLYALPLVVPSGMVFYTPLVPALIERNPDLAREVIHALNVIDRSRRDLYSAAFPKVK